MADIESAEPTKRRARKADPGLSIVYRSPADLTAYGQNARTHTPEQIEAIRASIKEFGFTNPILLKSDGVTIGAGHARHQAALAEGLETVPTITLHGLTDVQWRAYVIADNQLAIQGSGWDTEMLASELTLLNEEGFNLSIVGFNDDDLADMIRALDFEPVPIDHQGRLDEKNPVICPNCKHVFHP